MSIGKKLENKEGFFFITITCFNHYNLIQYCDGYQSIYNWMAYLVKSGIEISSFVIMPNHLHLLIYIPNEKFSIHNIIGNGKRFITYEIIQTLTKKGFDRKLKLLASFVNSVDRKKGSLHRFFTKSFEVKHCSTFSFVHQKVNYIHNNPVSGKWRLSSSFTEYFHSSAKFYLQGLDHEKVKVSDFRIHCR
jgi:REP element-mobilizing transposase RayT